MNKAVTAVQHIAGPEQDITLMSRDNWTPIMPFSRSSGCPSFVKHWHGRISLWPYCRGTRALVLFFLICALLLSYFHRDSCSTCRNACIFDIFFICSGLSLSAIRYDSPKKENIYQNLFSKHIVCKCALFLDDMII